MAKIDKKKNTKEKKLVDKLVGTNFWADSADLKNLDIDSVGKQDLKKSVIKVWEDGGNFGKIKATYYTNLEKIKEESNKRKTIPKEFISSKKKVLYKNDERTGKKRISRSKSILLLILFIIVCSSVITALNPITALSLESDHAEIGENANYYIIKGTADVGANVNVSSNELKLKNNSLNVISNGSFQYKVSIPKNIKNAEVKIIAKAENKSESQVSLKIERKESKKETKPKEDNTSKKESPKPTTLNELFSTPNGYVLDIKSSTEDALYFDKNGNDAMSISISKHNDNDINEVIELDNDEGAQPTTINMKNITIYKVFYHSAPSYCYYFEIDGKIYSIYSDENLDSQLGDIINI